MLKLPLITIINQKNSNINRYYSMQKKNPLYLHFTFLIPVIITICLIAVAFSLVIIYSDTEKNSNIIQNAISLTSLIVTGITLVFLYLTLKQQQGQIDDNKSDVEYNRVLDFVYRQLEISERVKNLKGYNYIYVIKLIETNDIEYLKIHEEYILPLIDKILGEVEIYLFTIGNAKLDVVKKQHLMFIVIRNFLDDNRQIIKTIDDLQKSHTYSLKIFN